MFLPSWPTTLEAMPRGFFERSETCKPRKPLRDNPIVLGELTELVCQVDVARYGVLSGFTGTVRHPSNVLYLTGGFVAEADVRPGELQDQGRSDSQPVTFATNSVYLITKDVLLHFDFPRGLEIVAFHFSLESPWGLDLFEGRYEIHTYKPSTPRPIGSLDSWSVENRRRMHCVWAR